VVLLLMGSCWLLPFGRLFSFIFLLWRKQVTW
jgi:hypothetical protein